MASSSSSSSSTQQGEACTSSESRLALTSLLLSFSAFYITFGLAYLVGYLEGRVYYPDALFLSTAIQQGWSHSFGGLGISIGLACLLITTLCKHVNDWLLVELALSQNHFYHSYFHSLVARQIEEERRQRRPHGEAGTISFMRVQEPGGTERFTDSKMEQQNGKSQMI